MPLYLGETDDITFESAGLSEVGGNCSLVKRLAKDVPLYTNAHSFSAPWQGTIIILGILGNILIFLVMTQKSNRRNSCSNYIAALAVSDSVALIRKSVDLLQILHGTTYTHVSCCVWVYIALTACQYSTFLVVCLTVDRLIYVRFIRCSFIYCKTKTAKRIMGVCLVVVLIINIPHTMLTEPVANNQYCAALISPRWPGFTLFYKILQAFMNFVIPFIALLAMTIMIICTLRKQRRQQAIREKSTAKTSSLSKGRIFNVFNDGLFHYVVSFTANKLKKKRSPIKDQIIEGFSVCKCNQDAKVKLSANNEVPVSNKIKPEKRKKSEVLKGDTYPSLGVRGESGKASTSEHTLRTPGTRGSNSDRNKTLNRTLSQNWKNRPNENAHELPPGNPAQNMKPVFLNNDSAQLDIRNNYSPESSTYGTENAQRKDRSKIYSRNRLSNAKELRADKAKAMHLALKNALRKTSRPERNPRRAREILLLLIVFFFILLTSMQFFRYLFPRVIDICANEYSYAQYYFVYQLSSKLYFTNCAINFFLYVCGSSLFRNSLKDLFVSGFTRCPKLFLAKEQNGEDLEEENNISHKNSLTIDASTQTMPSKVFPLNLDDLPETAV